jgi:hypothetical protein
MKTPSHHQGPEEHFGKFIVAQLELGNQQIPYEFTERLRAARTRALASRRIAKPVLVTASDAQLMADGSARMPFSSKAKDIYNMLVSFIPLICLAAGLMLLYDFHNDESAMELAEIDSALLIDDLPPHAYADPAFIDFLKIKNKQKD